LAFAAERRKAFAGQALAVQRLIGFCMLIRREVWEKVGGMDEDFGLGFFEDDDLCVRVREAGFQLVMALQRLLSTTSAIEPLGEWASTPVLSLKQTFRSSGLSGGG